MKPRAREFRARFFVFDFSFRSRLLKKSQFERNYFFVLHELATT